MKVYEYYRNEFPLENPFKLLDENEVQEIINNCDYTIECDKISAINFPEHPEFKINTADAIVFYMMGYNSAIEKFKKIFTAHENSR
jgi:hypothetical protein